MLAKVVERPFSSLFLPQVSLGPKTLFWDEAPIRFALLRWGLGSCVLKLSILRPSARKRQENATKTQKKPEKQSKTPRKNATKTPQKRHENAAKHRKNATLRPLEGDLSESPTFSRPLKKEVFQEAFQDQLFTAKEPLLADPSRKR